MLHSGPGAIPGRSFFEGAKSTMMTIGHSTLPIESFVRALKENGCRLLVDVRRYPGSRRYPQYSQETLFRSLAAEGIRGVWREALGGRRASQVGSVNMAWRNESFRGYADYMQTPVFEAQITWLMAQPEDGGGGLDEVAVMCAEAVPWRCHRSLIADAVLARGAVVEDIFVQPNGVSHSKPHILTEFAQTDGTRVWYPATQAATLFD
jgi:uncharacterized protein (DUF488 family)